MGMWLYGKEMRCLRYADQWLSAPSVQSFLKDAVKHGKIFLEPLSKFPLVKDLVTDRSSMFEMLNTMRVWTQEKSQLSYGQDHDLQYKAGLCLQCGCCLEVCPNFLAGSTFGGAAAMAEAYKAIE